MKFKLWLSPAICVYCLLISARSIKVSPKYSNAEDKPMSEIIFHSNRVSPTRHTFFKINRKATYQKYKKAHRADNSKTDDLANTSMITGIAAAAFMFMGLFIPYIILASIPVAIIA